jgi:Tfp pilus assembly protein FimT
MAELKRDLEGHRMRNESSSANKTCRAFVLIVFVMVVCAFLLVIAMPEHSSGIRRHYSTAAPANN